MRHIYTSTYAIERRMEIVAMIMMIRKGFSERFSKDVDCWKIVASLDLVLMLLNPLIMIK